MIDEESKIEQVLHFLSPKRFFKRLPRYLKKAFRGCFCFTCHSNPETVVPAHIRHGEGAGGSNKPDDDLCLPLCYDCHLEEGADEVRFWRRHGYEIGEIKEVARERYKAWVKNG